jgi:hypothetical protein
MKDLKRQDRNGTRTTTDIERKYRLGQIDYTKQEIEEMKKKIVVDTSLSTSSYNAIANSTVTIALNNKVSKETGKALSTNDFTDEYKKNLDTAVTNNHSHSNKSLLDTYSQTDANIADAINKKHIHNNKGVLDSYTKSQETLISEMSESSHTHTNKTVLDGITDDDIKSWNNLALYENGGTTDANTTTEPLILTKVNTPTTDFWYVKTLFYSSISNTTNRKQIAYSYKFDAPIYTRYYISGTWSEWTTGELESSSISDNKGHLWFKNGMLLQWGEVTITPTAANTVTSTEITFPKAYEFAPFITASPQIAYPDACTCSIGVGSTSAGAKAGMKIYMTRTNTSATNFRWFSVGYKST